jgi:hypothetical protein
MSLTFRTHKNETFLSSVRKELKKQHGPIIDEFDFTHAEQIFKGEIRYIDHTFTVLCAIAPVSSPANNGTIIIRQGPVSKPLEKEVVDAARLRLGVHWDSFIRIRVSPRLDSFERMTAQAALEVGYGFLLVGTRADGSKCHRNAVPDIKDLKEDSSYNIKAGGLYSQQPVHDGDGNRDNCSLIPYTPELASRIESIVKALRALAERVGDLLTDKDPAKVSAALMGANLLGFSGKQDT